MSRHGGVQRIPEKEEPASAHPPVRAMVLEVDGPGWRPSIWEIPADALVRVGRRVDTKEPDLKGLSIEWLMRQLESQER